MQLIQRKRFDLKNKTKTKHSTNFLLKIGIAVATLVSIAIVSVYHLTNNLRACLIPHTLIKAMCWSLPTWEVKHGISSFQFAFLSLWIWLHVFKAICVSNSRFYLFVFFGHFSIRAWFYQFTKALYVWRNVVLCILCVRNAFVQFVISTFMVFLPRIF